MEISEARHEPARERAKDLAIEKCGGAKCQNIKADTDHELIGAKPHTQDCLQAGEDDPTCDATEQAKPRIPGD